MAYKKIAIMSDVADDLTMLQAQIKIKTGLKITLSDIIKHGIKLVRNDLLIPAVEKIEKVESN